MPDNELQHCKRVLQRALGNSELLIHIVTELFLKLSFAQLSSAPNQVIPLRAASTQHYVLCLHAGDIFSTSDP